MVAVGVVLVATQVVNNAASSMETLMLIMVRLERMSINMGGVGVASMGNGFVEGAWSC